MRVHNRQATELPVNAMVHAVTVDDPYEYGAKITAAASLRDDPLGRLHARGQLDDRDKLNGQARYEAGRQYQRLFEAAEIGGVKAMDTTKEPVDGGKFSDQFTDRHQKAGKEIIRLGVVLGKQGDALIRDVLGKRMFIEQVARARGAFSQREMEYLGRRFRECLETLAREFRFA